MNQAMTAFELLGFATVVLGTFVFLGVLLVLAGVGAHVLYRCALRGAENYEADLRDGERLRGGRIPGVDAR